MSQLKKHHEGSILVGMVVFTVIMAIAASAYMYMMGSSTRMERAAYEDKRAFYAAESGLLVGFRWLRDLTNWNSLNLLSDTTTLYSDSINNIGVTVKIVKKLNDTVEVLSEAYSVNLPYIKELTVAILQDHQGYSTLINSIGPYGQVGGSGLNNTWFDGPVHSNNPIYLSAVSNPSAGGAGVKFVNGNVTVYNKDTLANFADGGHMANYGLSNNSYTFGIDKSPTLSERDPTEDPNVQTSLSLDLDDHFEGAFLHSRDSLHLLPMVGEDTILPVSDAAYDTPFLVYDSSGSASYFYYDASGVKQVLTISDVDSMTIRVPGEVKVLGVVSGTTTLITDSGNIYPVGDLTYKDFSPDDSDRYANFDNSQNYGIGDTSNTKDLLTLVASKGHIFFESKKLYFQSSDSTLQESGIANQKLYLTASLIANDSGYGTWWETKANGSIDINQYDYSLRAIGNRVIGQWFSYDAGGVSANQRIRFYYDTRFDDGLWGHDISDIVAVDDNGTILKLLSQVRYESNRGK